MKFELWTLDFFNELRLSLGGGNVHWSIAFMAILVSVMADGDLYLSLGLRSDSFFDQSILII